jgi:glyoxylase-like metal-dependent hydrolase (beta-lactamase superfamily II)
MNPVKVTPLYEGTFSVGIDYIFRRIDRADAPYKGALKLSINPFLVENGNQVVLFDAGLGDLFGEETSIRTILENLESQSVSDYEITDIFISHLHFDHMGGLANRENGYWEITFPEAKIRVSEKGWKKLYSVIDEQEEEKRDFFHFLDSHGDIEFLSDGDSPVEHFRTETIGGHTEFHQVLYFENGENRYLMAGDVIGTRGTINRTYAAKYDFNPEQSMKAREKLQKLSYEQGHAIMAYHETDHPIFRLSDYDEKKGYTIKNLV